MIKGSCGIWSSDLCTSCVRQRLEEWCSIYMRCYLRERSSEKALGRHCTYCLYQPAMISVLQNMLNCDGQLPPTDNCLICCFDHVLQLVINKACSSVPALDSAAGHIHKIRKMYVEAPELPRALERFCADLSMIYLSVAPGMDTRWISAWEIVGRLSHV